MTNTSLPETPLRAAVARAVVLAIRDDRNDIAPVDRAKAHTMSTMRDIPRLTVRAWCDFLAAGGDFDQYLDRISAREVLDLLRAAAVLDDAAEPANV